MTQRNWQPHEPTGLFRVPRDWRLGVYDHFVVHCSATPPSMEVDSEWIDQVHREKGYNKGCGYHVVITREGRIEAEPFDDPCRAIGAPGAHVGNCGPGWNTRSFGVCLVGGVNTKRKPADNFTVRQFELLRDVYLDFFNAHPTQQVWTGGHRDLIAKTDAPKKKACPSFDFKTWERMCELPQRVKAHDGDDIVPGREHPSLIDIPEQYRIARGDTLSEIARVYGVHLTDLYYLNPKVDPYKLQVGQILRLR